MLTVMVPFTVDELDMLVFHMKRLERVQPGSPWDKLRVKLQTEYEEAASLEAHMERTVRRWEAAVHEPSSGNTRGGPS